ncbi:MAG: hypothetical protein FD180_2804 [Planctomycetota bacterium]|nr:MAG: hypothetical protein FD180_2804 [Planctomycetota bacterium]
MIFRRANFATRRSPGSSVNADAPAITLALLPQSGPQPRSATWFPRCNRSVTGTSARGRPALSSLGLPFAAEFESQEWRIRMFLEKLIRYPFQVTVFVALACIVGALVLSPGRSRPSSRTEAKNGSTSNCRVGEGPYSPVRLLLECVPDHDLQQFNRMTIRFRLRNCAQETLWVANPIDIGGGRAFPSLSVNLIDQSGSVVYWNQTAVYRNTPQHRDVALRCLLPGEEWQLPLVNSEGKILLDAPKEFEGQIQAVYNSSSPQFTDWLGLLLGQPSMDLYTHFRSVHKGVLTQSLAVSSNR